MASFSRYDTAKGVRWRVQYRSPDGKPRTKRGFARKRDAEAWAVKNLADMAAGAWTDPALGKTTVAELWPDWIASKGLLAESSLVAMRNSWKTYVRPRWGEVQVAKIAKSDVQTWLAEHKEQASSIRRAHGILAGVMDLAVERRMVPANNARGVELPRKPDGKKVYLTAAQLAGLAKACGEYELLVLLLGFTGLRWGEATGLRAEDVLASRGRIHVRRAVKTIRHKQSIGGLKTHEDRVVAAPAAIITRLAELEPAPGGLLFHDDGQLLAPPDSKRGWFAQAVKVRMAVGELPARITPHGLRHVAAGLLVSSGANVKAVQRQLGHKSAAMTLDVYSDLFDGDLDEVAATLDNLLAECSQNVVTPVEFGAENIA